MHPIDRLGGLVIAKGPRRLRFFSDGWGDSPLLASLRLPEDDPQPAAIEWGRERHDRGLITQSGRYFSPARHLTDEVRAASLISVAPIRRSDRHVVLMAASNEHEPGARLAIAGHLARVGITSWIPENPFYGTRRPRPANDQPIRTVSDFVAMGAAAVVEGRALLATIRSEHGTPGVAGYSMGGNVAALISATMPFSVATAPLAAAHSPAPVYLDGVLRRGIDWDALGGVRPAAPRLETLLLRASVLNRPPRDHTRHAVLVAAKRDGYVPPAAVHLLHDHWPGSELRWVGGGHATLLWWGKATLARAIADSFRAGETAAAIG